MNLALTDILLAILAACAGAIAGWAHFASLERIATMITEGKFAAIGLQVARLVLLAVVLWVFAQGGALVLIAGAAGILAGRGFVMRRTD